jgi:hypothetical protein
MWHVGYTSLCAAFSMLLCCAGVQQLFQELFDIALDPSKHVLELDSSTAAKFSRLVGSDHGRCP